MTEIVFETIEAVLPLLEERSFEKIRHLLSEMNEVDIAELIEEVNAEQALVLYRLLPKEMAAEVFSYMEGDTQEKLLRLFTDNELAAVMEGLYMDDAADLLEEMPANVVKRLLKMTSPQDRKRLNQLLQYPEDSAGGVLTTEFVNLKAAMTVEEAFQYIRAFGPDKETIYTCYVTDVRHHLKGVLSVKDLLLADYQTLVGTLMEENPLSVNTTEDQETVAQLFAKYGLMALPVVDHENRLVGIITVDDVVDILQQEATEDIEKMAAITPTDKSYLKTGVLETFFKRIPWLLLLMISATFTGLIITSFEAALSASVVLTSFIPMLMDTGGNTGSQASVTVVRAMALGDITFRDFFRVLWKEFRVSILCGVVLSLTVFVKIMTVDRYLLGSPVGLTEALIVSCTLLVTVMVAKMIGCILPQLAKKIGLDPAVMASPFITATVDAVSLIVYFNIATSLLHLT